MKRNEVIKNLLLRYTELGFDNFKEVNSNNEKIMEIILDLMKRGKLIDSYEEYRLNQEDLTTPIKILKTDKFQIEDIDITIQMEKFLMLLEQAIEISGEEINLEEKKSQYLSKDDKKKKRQIELRISYEFLQQLDNFLHSKSENKYQEIDKIFAKVREVGEEYIKDKNIKFTYEDMAKTIHKQQQGIKEKIEFEKQMNRLNYDENEMKDIVFFIVEGNIESFYEKHLITYKRQVDKQQKLEKKISRENRKEQMKQEGLERYNKTSLRHEEIKEALQQWSSKIETIYKYQNQSNNNKRGKYHIK